MSVSPSFAAALAAYLPQHGEAADVQRVRDLIADGDPWARASALHLTGSALVVHVPTGRVLLRWHRRQRGWLQVGGHADPGEFDPLAVALREGQEETGLADLRPWPGPEIIHIAVVAVPAAQHEPAHEHADVRYLLATAQPELARPEDPGAPLRWLTVAGALAEVGEDNLRDTLRRAGARLAAATGTASPGA